MKAVLIARELEGDSKDEGLEIALDIDQIPPIGFPYSFYIPDADGVEGRLVLEVTGWDQEMQRSHDKRFSGKPIEIHAKKGYNSESGLDFLQVRKHLDHRLPLESETGPEDILNKSMSIFVSSHVRKKGMSFSEQFLTSCPRRAYHSIPEGIRTTHFGDLTVDQYIKHVMNNREYRAAGYGSKIREYIINALRELGLTT